MPRQSASGITGEDSRALNFDKRRNSEYNRLVKKYGLDDLS